MTTYFDYTHDHTGPDCKLCAESENITIAADDLPDGHPLKRLAKLWYLHTDDQTCWCNPEVYATAESTFINHHVIAEQAD